uniref:Uncharacterized protein n=1 Tax=Anguilla anguilla TaxID=7936 RepID=A0A0E9QW43_ANGAN
MGSGRIYSTYASEGYRVSPEEGTRVQALTARPNVSTQGTGHYI